MEAAWLSEQEQNDGTEKTPDEEKDLCGRWVVAAGPSHGESEQKKRRERQLGRMAGEDRWSVAAGRAEKAQSGSSASDQKLWTRLQADKMNRKTLTGRREEVRSI